MARKMKTMDGNSAVAHVSYAFTDVAAIYPITPSSVMADLTDQYSANGLKNLFGREVQVTEMQSEGGAAGAVHGSLAAGALTTTYTASQGLLLMIPNMYKMAGELLPGVIHVSARALTSHALSIFGDHSDVYACRQTGYAMLCSNNPQECMDLGAVAHLTAIKGRVPFLHFFDGFRTSHEIQKIEEWDYADLADMLDWDAVEEFRRRSLNPEHPVTRGTAQNDDIFFQAREACNQYYDAVPEVVIEYMNKVNEKIGTNYKPFNYYGAADAEHVIVAMGSVCDCAEEVVDYLNAAGEKVGLLKVRLYRPFVGKYMTDELPKTVKTISVLDRTKEPGSIGEPLYLDVLAALNDSEFAGVKVYAGRYGLGSKDTTPGDVIAVYRNAESEAPKKRFTIGIVDDVTNLSLPVVENPDTTPAGTHSCKFWGLGADGTVGANKNSIKIIGDHTDMYAQGYFAYDSKKSGGLTVSHLRFGSTPIKSTYYISKADFVACHNPSYVDKYDIVDDLKEGGSFLLNCAWDVEELTKRLPGKMKRILAERKINFYTIDAIQIGKEIGLGGRVNTVLQSAFFKIADIIPAEEAKEFMKAAAKKSYLKKGQAIVDMNYAAIDRGMEDLKKVEIPAEWANAVDEAVADKAEGEGKLVDYVNKVLKPVNAYKGNQLPVSALACDGLQQCDQFLDRCLFHPDIRAEQLVEESDVVVDVARAVGGYDALRLLGVGLGGHGEQQVGLVHHGARMRLAESAQRPVEAHHSLEPAQRVQIQALGAVEAAHAVEGRAAVVVHEVGEMPAVAYRQVEVVGRGVVVVVHAYQGAGVRKVQGHHTLVAAGRQHADAQALGGLGESVALGRHAQYVVDGPSEAQVHGAAAGLGLHGAVVEHGVGVDADAVDGVVLLVGSYGLGELHHLEVQAVAARSVGEHRVVDERHHHRVDGHAVEVHRSGGVGQGDLGEILRRHLAEYGVVVVAYHYLGVARGEQRVVAQRVGRVDGHGVFLGVVECVGVHQRAAEVALVVGACRKCEKCQQHSCITECLFHLLSVCCPGQFSILPVMVS